MSSPTSASTASGRRFPSVATLDLARITLHLVRMPKLPQAKLPAILRVHLYARSFFYVLCGGKDAIDDKRGQTRSSPAFLLAVHRRQSRPGLYVPIACSPKPCQCTSAIANTWRLVARRQ